jgi:UDP-glucuronate decarboxylase
MRVLVTGGAGFIGSHLIDRLMEQGYEVLCLDNFYTGHKRNLLKWLAHPYFELIRHDVTEPIRLEVDQIYHLACPASPVHYQYNPVKTIKTNVTGTLNMLGLAKRVKARFLLASTSEVYGDPSVHPQPEDYRGNVNCIGIRSCYDEGKRVAETLAFDYYRQNQVDIRVARIFNTYGPRMLENDGRVVSNFIFQALRGIPLTVYGDGSQTRSFCYVSDLVEGLMRLMNGEYIGPVNIGNPGEYTILELAKTIQEMVNPETELVFKPLPEDDPQQRQPDITRAKTWLGWEPTIPLQEGLKLTIEDFQARMEAQKS